MLFKIVDPFNHFFIILEKKNTLSKTLFFNCYKNEMKAMKTRERRRNVWALVATSSFLLPDSAS